MEVEKKEALKVNWTISRGKQDRAKAALIEPECSEGKQLGIAGYLRALTVWLPWGHRLSHCENQDAGLVESSVCLFLLGSY